MRQATLLRGKRGSKATRLNAQIKRARALARSSDGLVADLYLLHAQMCEESRDSIKPKARRPLSD